MNAPMTAQARRGFTLLEMAISLALFSTMVATISYVQTFMLRSWRYELNRIEAKSEPNMALEKLWADLEPVSAVTTADATQVVATTPSGASITYQWDGATRRLTRTAGGVSVVIANRLSTADLNYYTAAGAALTRPVPGPLLSTIRTIQVDLQGEVTSAGGAETVTLRTSVSPRNLP